ncbi:MAG: MmcQ/YjbR family DNA-binding protein [Gemmatimonadota bacterium]
MTRRPKGSTLADLRRLALALPGVTERPSYGTPGFRAGGKLFARLREDGQTLVLRVSDIDRDLLLRTAPAVFYLTDHYKSGPWILLRLAAAKPALLASHLIDAWRTVAPPRSLAAFDGDD